MRAPPWNAASLFGLAPKGEPAEAPDDEPPAAEDAQPEPESQPLTDDQAELKRRYDLTDLDASSVRGDSWSEMCEDAERLRGLAEANAVRAAAREHVRGLQDPDHPNHHLAGLLGGEGAKQRANREWLEAIQRPREDGGRMSQPRRVRFIGGVPFPVIEDQWPMRPGLVDFDGGARPLPPTPPRLEWARDEGGWWTTTIEDGADLFFPGVRGR